MGLKDAIRRAQEEREGRAAPPLAAPAGPKPGPPAAPGSPPPGREASPYAALDETGLQKIIDRIEEIPTLPVIASRVMDTINNPLSDAKSIGEIIRNDQALSAKVLRMANSAFYKGYSDITSIQTAVARLGIMQIKRMVFTLSVFDTFAAGGDEAFPLRDFWRHAMAVATAARIIGERTGAPDLEDLYTSGILHDIGKLIMAGHVKEMFGGTLERLRREPPCTFLQAERELFRHTHRDIGSWLAVKWNLARRVQNVVFGHHEPNLDTATFTRDVLLFPAIVHIADVLANRNGFSTLGGSTELDPAAVEFVFGRRGGLEQAEEKLASERAKIEAFLEQIK